MSAVKLNRYIQQITYLYFKVTKFWIYSKSFTREKWYFRTEIYPENCHFCVTNSVSDKICDHLFAICASHHQVLKGFTRDRICPQKSVVIRRYLHPETLHWCHIVTYQISNRYLNIRCQLMQWIKGFWPFGCQVGWSQMNETGPTHITHICRYIFTKLNSLRCYLTLTFMVIWIENCQIRPQTGLSTQ